MTKILMPIASYAELEMLVSNGAEEFYCGVVPQEWLDKYTGVLWMNRRSPVGANLQTAAELRRLVRDAHASGVPVFITLNAPSYTSEQIPYLVELAKRFETDMGIDALIVSDVGLIVALREAGVRTPLHLSSIASTLNSEAVRFFIDLGAARVILPRSLSLAEIAVIMERVRGTVELEVFIFNDGCVFEEGFCYTTHHHAVGAICTNLIGCAYDFIPLKTRAKDEVTEEDLSAHLQDYRDWIWTLNGRGIAFSPTGFPLGPCGLCALSRLCAMGVASIKIVGREASPFKKLASLKIVKKVLDRVRQGASREEAARIAQKLKGTPELCTSGYACYYRDANYAL